MPKGWTDKDERQYEHIKQSSLDRGISESRAGEIAARTVNDKRREEGRTEGPSRETGNPNAPLEELSRNELYNRAKSMNIGGRSSMTKPELVEAIRREQ